MLTAAAKGLKVVCSRVTQTRLNQYEELVQPNLVQYTVCHMKCRGMVRDEKIIGVSV